ncbi:trehalase isoform X3 [Bacillus rossius redtenbacheri]
MDILKTTIFSLIVASSYALPPPCPSDIYCHGELLHTVQMASLYQDSKTFVDMKLRRSPRETLQQFRALMQRTGSRPSRDQVHRFVNDSFEPEGSEFVPWDPPDWVEQPAFLAGVRDSELRRWGQQLNNLWKLLGRKIKDEVRDDHDKYSIIYVPNPVIVPGGRFREFYYWDSYWIVRGLLLSEMRHTVKGMLENFLSIVDEYGFVPNGGRIYYSMRSQPPLLIPMVDSYVESADDDQFVRDHIHTMEKEFQYWLTNHTVVVEKDGKSYRLARYYDASDGPRPESYREDFQSAMIFKTDDEKQNFYSELKAGAESGWDFSSRWFILNATNKGNLTNLKVRSIIPVDLNAILYWNAKILSSFYHRIDMPDKAVEYMNVAQDWLQAVTDVLWHEEVGAWLDYDTLNEVKRDYFYPTNIAPLWTGCYHPASTGNTQVAKILKYLDKTQVMINLGGIPATLEHSGEQWDYPNAWPPLQYIMILGLEATGDDWAKELAFQISEKWVRSNYKAYNESLAMFEKYDATVPGGHGGGGEYNVQVGFGWTNGVILELLHKYGGRLSAEDRFVEERPPPGTATAGVSTMGQVLTLVVALLTPLAVGCLG